MRFRALFAVVAWAACLVCLSPAGVRAEDWVLPRNNSRLTNSTLEPMRLPLALAWRFGTGSTDPGNRSQPAVIGNTVVFAAGRRVYALDALTGARKWVYPADQPLGAVIRSSIAIYSNRVYFGASDGDLYQLALSDGRLIGVYHTGGPVRSSPVIEDGRLFIGSDDNALHSVDPLTGEPFWLGGFRTRDDVPTIPAVAGGLVYFASRDTFLYAAGAQTGRLFWMYRIPVPVININPVVGGDSVYITAGSQLISFSARGGVRRWQLTFPAEIAAPPAMADQVLYVPLRNGKMYAVLTTGKLAWEKPVETVFPVRCSPMVAGNTVVTAAERGVISAFDIGSGQLMWRYVLPPIVEAGKKRFNNVEAPPVWSNGALYVVADDGALYCFRPDAPDDEAPEIFFLTPSPGMQVSGSPPLRMSAAIEDRGSGIVPDSVVMLLDGQPVEHQLDPDSGTVSYSTPLGAMQTPLQDGRHEVTVQALDWKGNALDFTWSFVVDNTLPKPRVRAPRPAAPAAARTGRQPGVEEPQPAVNERRGWGRGRGRDQEFPERQPDEIPPMPPPPPPPPGGPGMEGPPGPGGPPGMMEGPPPF